MGSSGPLLLVTPARGRPDYVAPDSKIRSWTVTRTPRSPSMLTSDVPREDFVWTSQRSIPSGTCSAWRSEGQSPCLRLFPLWFVVCRQTSLGHHSLPSPLLGACPPPFHSIAPQLSGPCCTRSAHALGRSSSSASEMRPVGGSQTSVFSAAMRTWTSDASWRI